MNQLVIDCLTDAFFASLAGAGFAMLSNPPLRTIFISALLAAIAHSFRYLLMQWGVEIAFATLIVSFLVGALSIPFAHWVHSPPDVFAFPSLLPMIPGMLIYKTILGLIKYINVEELAGAETILLTTVQSGLKATFILLSLSIGVSLPMLLLGKSSVKSTRLPKIFKREIFNFLPEERQKRR